MSIDSAYIRLERLGPKLRLETVATIPPERLAAACLARIAPRRLME